MAKILLSAIFHTDNYGNNIQYKHWSSKPHNEIHIDIPTKIVEGEGHLRIKKEVYKLISMMV